MSVVSGRTSLVSLVRKSLCHRNSLVKAKFHIVPHQIESALHDLIQKNDSKKYEELVCILRDGDLSDDDLTLVLSECSLCVGILDRETRLLVEVLCSINWSSRPTRIIDLFSRWMLDLLTSQIYHAPMAIGALIKALSISDSVWNEVPSAEQTKIFSNVHNLIARVVAVIPMSSEVLLRCAVDHFPYYKNGNAKNQAYVHNLLWISRYVPSLTDHLLALVLNRLIVMDVNIRSSYESADDGEEMFTMDTCENVTEAEQLVECLDLCMLELFHWLHLEGSKVLDTLFVVFERTILPTHGTRFVQFVLLFGLSLDVTRTKNVLETLWQLVASARVGPGIRQASIVYLVGLIARANFIPPLYVHYYIKKISDWCHSYIVAQDVTHSQSVVNPHSVFYSVCQSLFYLIAFKHTCLFSDKKGLSFVESLNLPRIVMCSLNPLRMCPTAVAEAFASITRMHQLVYCHTIMEHNARHFLRIDNDSLNEQEWFPYDPYILPRSSKWIKPVYGEYEDTLMDKEIAHIPLTEVGCDEDDFLATSPNTDQINSLSKCSFPNFRVL